MGDRDGDHRRKRGGGTVVQKFFFSSHPVNRCVAVEGLLAMCFFENNV